MKTAHVHGSGRFQIRVRSGRHMVSAVVAKHRAVRTVYVSGHRTLFVAVKVVHKRSTITLVPVIFNY